MRVWWLTAFIPPPPLVTAAWRQRERGADCQTWFRPVSCYAWYNCTVKVTFNDLIRYKVAGAIAGKIRDNERVSITAIGPESVYQTVQSIAISRTYLQEDQIDIKFSPQFIKITIQGEERYSCSILYCGCNSILIVTGSCYVRSALFFSILSRRLWMKLGWYKQLL